LPLLALALALSLSLSLALTASLCQDNQRLGYNRRRELDGLCGPAIMLISGVRPARNLIRRKILFHLMVLSKLSQFFSTQPVVPLASACPSIDILCYADSRDFYFWLTLLA
jgi:hypothetical protein